MNEIAQPKPLVWPPLNSLWKENDKRLKPERHVRVVMYKKTLKLVGIVNVDSPSRPQTWARLHRFNGKANGYTRIEIGGQK